MSSIYVCVDISSSVPCRRIRVERNMVRSNHVSQYFWERGAQMLADLPSLIF